jgi:2-oxoglutarate/2-oxoacid ferredoxin oxidoreductase subunit alpha
VTKQVQELDHVIIRFAGDSGDGMQLTGDRFTQETAVFGNDLSTLPNFPAEIRAPQGTLPGVSSFQLHFADHDILTPGDAPDVLVAMNPAALMANLKDLPLGGDLILDTDEFTKRNLAKVGYAKNPLEDGSALGVAQGRELGQRPAVGLLLLPSAWMEESQVSMKPSGSCSPSPA